MTSSFLFNISLLIFRSSLTKKPFKIPLMSWGIVYVFMSLTKYTVVEIGVKCSEIGFWLKVRQQVRRDEKFLWLFNIVALSPLHFSPHRGITDEFPRFKCKIFTLMTWVGFNPIFCQKLNSLSVATLMRSSQTSIPQKSIKCQKIFSWIASNFSNLILGCFFKYY